MKQTKLNMLRRKDRTMRMLAEPQKAEAFEQFLTKHPDVLSWQPVEPSKSYVYYEVELRPWVDYWKIYRGFEFIQAPLSDEERQSIEQKNVFLAHYPQFKELGIFACYNSLYEIKGAIPQDDVYRSLWQALTEFGVEQ
jgi:hypothetical protein